MINPFTYVRDYFRLRSAKERVDTVTKTFIDNRAMQTYLPQAPEIIPYPQNGTAIRSMVFRVSTLRAVIENLTTEVFRTYPEIVPAFQMKCYRCGTEYQTYKKVCDNPECVLQGIENLPPDPIQKQKFLEWKDKVNKNGQSFWDVAKQFNWESDALDNPWVLFSFDYIVDPLTSEVAFKRLEEMNIAKAETMRMIQDNYGVPGGLIFTCIEHRNVRKSAKERYALCPHCGKMLYDVHHVSVKLNQPTGEGHSDSVDNLYIPGEAFSKPYWTHTTNYGISNVYSLWILATSLWYMDELENSTYKHGRPPKSLLIFNSYSPASITAQLNDEIRQQELNRNYMMKLAYPFESKTPAQVLNLMPSDQELQNLEHRQEIKKEIGVLYGQNPFFLGDMSTGGGLNNEGLQQTTMLKRVETKMKWLEEGLFKATFEALGITDWVLKFPPPKESDRMAVVTRRQSNLKMLGEVLDRGGDYNILSDEDWEFQIIGHLTRLENPAQVGQKEQPGMSGWNIRDFQSKDQTFQFSKMSVEAKDIVDWFINEMALVSALSHPDDHIPALLNQFKEKLREHLMIEWTRRVRRGMDASGAMPTEVDIDLEVVKLHAGKGEMDRALDDIVQYIRQNVTEIQNLEIKPQDLFQIGSEVRGRISNIIETEEAVFTNLGRVAGYEMMDPDDDEYDYDWVGPEFSPGRSTECCQAIKEKCNKVRTQKGRVSLDEVRQIVAEEGAKEHGAEKAFNLGREWMPHYNCRHVVVGRNIKLGKGLKYIHDPSEAPEGVQVQRGPRGGYYYEETARSKQGGNDGELDSGDAPAGGNSDGGGTANGGEGKQGEYTAIGVRDLNGVKWEIQFANPQELEQIKGVLEQQGYTFDEKSGVYVNLIEAVAKKDKFNPNELWMGIKVEMEHTDDVDVAMKIAMDHLRENPKYYTILDEAGLVDEKV